MICLHRQRNCSRLDRRRSRVIGYTLKSFVRQWLTLSQFITGTREEANFIEQEYAAAGIELVMVLQHYYTTVVEAQGKTSPETRMAQHETLMATETACDELVGRWRELIPPRQHYLLKECVQQWRATMLMKVKSYGVADRDFEKIADRWQQAGGNAPSQPQVKDAIFPWPPEHLE